LTVLDDEPIVIVYSLPEVRPEALIR